MSSSLYEDYEVVENPRHHKHRHHHRDRDRDYEVVEEVVRDNRAPRYTTTQETYVKKGSASSPNLPDGQYLSRQTELIRRPVREDSDMSIEEVRRDFPPPGHGADGAYYRQVSVEERRGGRRARSMERDYEDDYYRDSARKGRDNLVVEEKVERRRSLSRNQKIIAAVSGAALAVGGKELWDRRQAGEGPRERNVLGTAAVGAAGAFAAYEGAELYTKHHGKVQEKVKHYAAFKGKNGPEEIYYSDEEEVKPEKKSRRKSLVEGALGLVGAGAAAKALGGGGDRDRRDRDYDSRSVRSIRSTRSRSITRKGQDVGTAKLQQAAKAALMAGAVEAFRVRKEPGGWSGAKAQRILTAAVGSGAVDAVADKNPDKHSKRHIMEAVMGGLLANRAVNGSRKEIDEDFDGRSVRSRSRSRSRARSRSRSKGPGGNLAALATAAAAGLAGKKMLDRSRSRSRRRRSPSIDSFDSRSPSPRRDRHKRSKSVTDFARKGLAAIGLGEAAEGAKDKRSREVEETRITRTRYSDESSDDEYDRRRRRSGDSRGSRRKEGRRSRGKGSDSSSDLGSSTDDEKHRKKMKARNRRY